MNHSNQIREYQLTSQGVKLIDAYLGSGGVLAGTARITQEAIDQSASARRAEETERKHREIDRKRLACERRIAEMRSALEAEEEEVRRSLQHDEDLERRIQAERAAMAVQRGGSSK